MSNKAPKPVVLMSRKLPSFPVWLRYSCDQCQDLNEILRSSFLSELTSTLGRTISCYGTLPELYGDVCLPDEVLTSGMSSDSTWCVPNSISKEQLEDFFLSSNFIMTSFVTKARRFDTRALTYSPSLSLLRGTEDITYA